MLNNTKRDRFGPLFVHRIGSVSSVAIAKMCESETLTANQDGKRLVGPLRDDAETSSYKPEHTKRCP